MERSSTRAWSVVGVLVATWGAAPAAAQPAEPEQHSEELKDEAPAGDETVAEISAGGNLNTGNTESWQANAGGRLRLVRGPHAFSSDAQLAYGQANLPDDMSDAYEDTVRNFNMRARYDFFFTDADAVFVGASYRWDTFAGLDTRLQGQVGYLRNIFKEENHRLWTEVGYDITYDNFHPDPLLDEMGNPLPGDDVIHSARGFVGYDNRLNEAVTFNTGLEVLVNVQDAEDTRLSWDAALRSSIAGQLQLEIRHTLKFDNVPVPGNDNLDTTTQLNLIYTFMEEKEEPAEEGAEAPAEASAG